jgi:hypothetical protein
MSIPAVTTPAGISGLKFGTTFEEALTITPRDKAQRAFIEDRIKEMISQMSVEEFVRRVKALELPEKRINELLRYTPDKERRIAKRLLSEEALYTPVGHAQFAKTTKTRPVNYAAKVQRLLQAPGKSPEEQQELYTERELREMKLAAERKLPKRHPVSEKELAQMIVSVKEVNLL